MQAYFGERGRNASERISLFKRAPSWIHGVLFMFRGRPLLFLVFTVVLLVDVFVESLFLSLNFLYKLKFWLQNIPIDRRKPITFAFCFFLPALFLIWGFLASDISSGVYNRNCLALFTSQSWPWTFRFGYYLVIWSCTCFIIITFRIYDNFLLQINTIFFFSF